MCIWPNGYTRPVRSEIGFVMSCAVQRHILRIYRTRRLDLSTAAMELSFCLMWSGADLNLCSRWSRQNAFKIYHNEPTHLEQARTLRLSMFPGSPTFWQCRCQTNAQRSCHFGTQKFEGYPVSIYCLTGRKLFHNSPRPRSMRSRGEHYRSYTKTCARSFFYTSDKVWSEPMKKLRVS